MARASDDEALVRADDGTRALDLASGRRVEVEERAGAEILRVRSRDGACVLTVELGERGPVLRFEGAALELVATRSLDVACGELRIEAEGAARIAARSIDLEARRGGVEVAATDDVRIEGERVLLNSKDPPMPRSYDEYLERKGERARLPPAEPAPGSERDPQRDS